MNSPARTSPLPLNVVGLNCTADTWLSQAAGMPCFNVTAPSLGMEPLIQPSYAPSLYVAKVDVKEVAQVDDLVGRGFRPVDTALTLRYDHKRLYLADRWKPSIDLVIDDAGPEDVDAVVGIAASAFRLSRFHLDPYFPSDSANRIKSEWARNLALGVRGSGCLVARKDGNVVAFLGYLHASDSEPLSTIDLIAVDTAARGTGVGAAIVSALIAASDEQGRAVLVGTQAANRDSVRLYEKLGFRLDSASYVLHGHLTELENL